MAERKRADLPPIPDRRYFTTSEAAELVGVAASVLRFWEEEFKQLAPSRHGARRRYERRDILVAREIRVLLYERGFTLSGAKKFLRHQQEERKKPESAPDEGLADGPAEQPISSSSKVSEAPHADAPKKSHPQLIEELEKIRNSIKNFLL